MIDSIRKGLTQLGVLAANPLSFAFVAIFTLVWYVVERHTLDWHGIATVLTLIIALVIHRSTHRDAQALHAKLDALIRAVPSASDALADIDEKEPEEIELHRNGRSNKYRT
jgi:low affinity Fe/Cu permease